MRGFVIVVVVLALLPGSVSAGAAKLGKVIYVKTVGDQSDAPADVWEKDLDTGANRVIVSHKALPNGFETRPENALLSPSGRYLYVAECSGVITKSGRQYGDTFVFGPGDGSAKWIGAVHWCWDRVTGKWQKIADGGSISIAEVSWSPTKDLLLIQMQEEKSRIYDPSNGKSEFIPAQESLQWSAVGDGLVSVIGGYGSKLHSVGVRAVGGKRKALFTCPAVWGILAQSRNGTFAVLDSEAFRLVGSKGKRLAKISIPVAENGCFRAECCFNHSGSRLLVSTSHQYGEPALNLDEATWVVDTKTMKARALADTHGAFGFSADDEVGSFDILGWLPDDRSVLLREGVVPGISYGSESQGCSSAVCIYDVAMSAKPRKLFDTGKSCIALSWWPGPRQ
jgi:hypothetical protein